jgi:RNA-binding protein NOB1
VINEECSVLVLMLSSLGKRLCKDPTKKFCPSCGNTSLIRTSITYVTPSPENPKGYILHLKSNYQYKLRGTQYSIPTPKQGSSNAMKNSRNAELILREDQKEYQRGLRSADYLKKKQERAALKAVKGGKSAGTASVFSGWDDPDWTPEMLMGANGRKGTPQGVRIGKDGLPIVSLPTQVFCDCRTDSYLSV